MPQEQLLQHCCADMSACVFAPSCTTLTHACDLMCWLPLQTLQQAAAKVRKAREILNRADKSHNMFALIRFDLMLDENLQAFVTEVRGSLWTD